VTKLLFQLYFSDFQFFFSNSEKNLLAIVFDCNSFNTSHQLLILFLMPGAEEDGPSEAEQVTGRILGPVERAIFEKYKRKVCNDNPTIHVDCNPVADCHAAEPVVNNEYDINENAEPVVNNKYDINEIAAVAKAMVDNPMMDYNFGCTDKSLEDPDNVPVAEANGLQLLLYFDKVLPPENEIDNLVSLTNDGSLNEPVVHSDSTVPFCLPKNPSC
jgi:hypothetical protein